MPKRKASFYGVRVGKQPGVYDDWEECKEQVHGFPRSKFKGFSTRTEAEDFVNGYLTNSQTMAAPRTELFRSRTNINAGTVKPCAPPMSNSKKDDVKPSFSSIPQQGVNLPHLSPDDLTKCFKVIEENGTKFVRFECIKDFDLYFESLCCSRGSNDVSRMDISLPRDDYGSQDKVSDSFSQSQKKELVEDEDFIYFKDEDDLWSFLKPYFEDATRKHVQAFPTSDVVERAPWFTNQEPSRGAEPYSYCDASQATLSNQSTTRKICD